MAIDFGDKRVGIAISDELCQIAQGHSVLDGEDQSVLINEILELIKDYEIKKIVLGLPRNMDGCNYPFANSIWNFIYLLVDDYIPLVGSSRHLCVPYCNRNSIVITRSSS